MPNRYGPNRIHELRKAAHLTLEELASKVRPVSNHQTIQRLEKGERELTASWMRRLGEALDVEPAELLWKPSSSTATVPVVGYVGAGDRYYPDPEAGAWRGVEEVEAPTGAAPGTVALRVRGASMAPVYRDGDLLFFERDTRRDPGELLGAECVVQVVDGPCYLKIVQRESKSGRYTLHSYDPTVAPIDDVRLEWAALVDWVRKAKRQ